jgi:hypothetical protein
MEDQSELRDWLLDILQANFTGFAGDQASSVEDANTLIKRAVDCREPYNVAILDFMLPEHPGEPPQFDTSISDLVSNHYPDALIIHLTGYSCHPVMEHFAKLNHVFVDKCQLNWSSLIDVIQCHVKSHATLGVERPSGAHSTHGTELAEHRSEDNRKWKRS